MSQSGSSQVRIELSAAGQPAGGGSSVAPSTPVPQPDDRTVISDRSPVGSESVPSARLQPFELGALLAGDRLGHFELLEYVGGGGMGAVFRARDTLLDREVALKVLSRAQGADEETRRRFHVEAQSAARLDHQNVARVYYVGEDRGLNFIAFEYIRGVNVRDLVERSGPLPLADAMSFTLQVAEALAHANQRNVVHRDIKPSNIIVTGEGRAKLVDMGLARLHANTANDDLTASGVTLGTFDYISPEQARDPRTADVRSDIYSLGCTLYYMLTARPPFPDGTVLQKLLQHQADDVPDPRQFNADVPEQIAIVLRRMLAKDPRRRFQDAGELIGELLLVSDRLNLRPVTTGQFWIAPQYEGRAVWERHLPWFVPVAALLLIAATVQWTSSFPSLAPLDSAVSGPVTSNSAGSAQILSAERDEPQATSIVTSPRDDGDLSNVPTSGNPTGDAVRASPAGASGRDQSSHAATPPGHFGTTPQPDEDSAAAPADDLVVRAVDKSPETFDEFAPSAANQTDKFASADRDVESPRPPSNARPVERLFGQSPSVTVAPIPPAPAAAPQTTGITILARDGGEAKQFTSLKAACSAAKNNDVIELGYNGVRDEEPIELTNLKLTIRAGEGLRPIVSFGPGRIGFAGFGRSMITVAGGRLNLFNVGVLLDIPRDATAEGWSLFETRQAEQLRLEGCALTIRNPGAASSGFHEDVSFFEIKAAPGVDTMMKMPEAPLIHPVNLDLQNCIARGEAAFVHSADAQPLALDWENGLLATTGPLLLAEGTSATPPSGERVEISISHLTAIAVGGLIRLASASDAPYLLKTEVICANSFLVTRDAPLVEQQGPQRTPILEQQFQWSGDRNFCQGFSVFWKLVDLGAQTVPRLVSWPQWQTLMGQGDKLLAPYEKIWKRAAPDDRPVHALRREDFVIADRLRGPSGQFEASDAGEVGMDARKLPDLAAEPPLVLPRDAQRRQTNPGSGP
jgi:serine/threonine protein kinase